MVAHVYFRFGDLLKKISLSSVMRAIKNGVLLGTYNFFGMLERYNMETCTLFTPVEEM